MRLWIGMLVWTGVFSLVCVQAAVAQEGADGLSSPGLEPSIPAPTTSGGIDVPDGYGSDAPAYPFHERQAAPLTGGSGPLQLRMRALDGHMGALAQAGQRSISDSVIAILSGGLSIGLGVYIDDPLTAAYMYAFGGVHVARAVVDLSLRPDPITPSIALAQMPQDTPERLLRRVTFAEGALRDLAHRHRLLRFLDGGLGVALGVGIIPVLASTDGFHFDNYYDYVVISGALASAIAGAVRMFTQTTTERRWEAYRTMRAGVDTQSDTAATATQREPVSARSWAVYGGATPYGATFGFRHIF